MAWKLCGKIFIPNELDIKIFIPNGLRVGFDGDAGRSGLWESFWDDYAPGEGNYLQSGARKLTQ